MVMLIRLPGRGRKRKYFLVSGMMSSKPVSRDSKSTDSTQTPSGQVRRYLPDIQIGIIVGMRAESMMILELDFRRVPQSNQQ